MKKIFVPKSYDFREKLAELICERRIDPSVKFDYSEASQCAFLHQNIAPVQRPPTEELVSKHRSRFSDKHL